MWKSLAFLFIGSLTAISQDWCFVEMRVVDENARELPYRVFSYKNSKTGQHFETQFNKSSAQVPCGKYEYVLGRDDLRNPGLRVVGSHTLDSPENWFTFQQSYRYVDPSGRMGAIHRGDYVVEGKVTPTGVKNAWIRFQSPFTPSEFIESKIANDGSFELHSPPEGLMVFYISDHNGILHVGKATVETGPIGRGPIIIDISAKK